MKLTIVPGVVLGMICGAALAAPGPEDKPLPPEKQAKVLAKTPGADANSDGVITESEMRAAMAAAKGGSEKGMGPLALLVPTNPAEILASHPEADTNRDGRLDADERRVFVDGFRAQVEADLIAAYPAVDANRDGRLGPDELRTGQQTVEQYVGQRILAEHPEADTDRDGRLNREEMRAYREAQSAGQVKSATAQVDWLISNFQKVDADGNGQVSLEELQQYKARFAGKQKAPKEPKAKATGEDRGRKTKEGRKASKNQAAEQPK
jgi:Ca2+-binding EF-hand superfamily protein